MINNYWRKIARIGIPENIICLKPYTVIWKWVYQIEKSRLKISLCGHVDDIQHVGSTAIPGMHAKPIIDMCLAISDYRSAMLCVHRIENLGYKYKGENGALQQHYFVKGIPASYHLYMVENGNKILENGVYFRDYLKQYSDVATNYVILKQQLALQFATDLIEYQKAKQSFVNQVIEKAKAELNYGC